MRKNGVVLLSILALLMFVPLAASAGHVDQVPSFGPGGESQYYWTPNPIVSHSGQFNLLLLSTSGLEHTSLQGWWVQNLIDGTARRITEFDTLTFAMMAFPEWTTDDRGFVVNVFRDMQYPTSETTFVDVVHSYTWIFRDIFDGTTTAAPEPPRLNALRVWSQENPASRAAIRYQSADNLPATIDIYTVDGRLCRHITQPRQSPGINTIPVGGLPSGSYFARVKTGNQTGYTRLTVVR